MGVSQHTLFLRLTRDRKGTGLMMNKICSFVVYLFLFSCLRLSAQDSLTILFAGDAMMHQTQLDNTRRGDSFDLSGYFSNIEKEVQAADIAVVNFEVPLGGKPYSGYPAFSAPEDFALALQKAGFDFFLLANNHCLDRRTRGLVRTIRMLDSLEIRHTGTFLDLDHRHCTYPMLLRKKDFRIIMLNYTYDTNGLTVDTPRIVNYIDKEVMEADIAEAKLFNPDFIIANMHWGLEYEQIPSREQRRLADWLMEQGVDLVIGCHPHVVQPMELWRGQDGVPDRLIVYSLGNFISNMSRENTDGGAMLKVVLCRKGLRRYIASAQYSLVYCSRYENEQGKEDIRVVPAVSWSEKKQNSSFSVDSALIKYIKNTRSLLKEYNKEVEEYLF